MTEARIYLSPPSVGPEEEALLVAALRSGWVAPLGPEVEAFETELATRCGRAHAVALSSGTAALHLALLAAGVKAGDTVVTATMTFAATANAIRYVGAEPVFIDCDASGNLDPQLLTKALSALRADGIVPAAILPIDFLGKVADYPQLQRIAGDTAMISDAAESLGASRDGAPAGSFGSMAALSFNGNKIITTSGGGALLTDEAELAARVRHLATQAREPLAHYEHTEVGYNYRMSNLLAAVGRAQLGKLDQFVQQRRAWRQRYRDLLSEVPGVTVFGGEDAEDNHWLTAILVNPHEAGWTASDLGAAFAARNIETRPLWKPMHLQPAFRGSRAFINGTSEQIFTTGLALPSGSGLTEDDWARINSTLRAFIPHIEGGTP
ncbi:MAG: pyridoxal-5'-phosphate-dependent protein [Actinobacteria bacterium HGW-Actinobacteria-2]|nr:MAG: pyridoxal-5'-phosphate-dependent protein [Actinobacteria bacterium HGW-Actinobacteria-2]